TTRFIDDTPALLAPTKRQDRAPRLLRYIADVTVNGHPDVAGRARPPATARAPKIPRLAGSIIPGTRQLLESQGPVGVT
ncbi:hypothetical protein, partial [Listeria monocytogenes]|uniref:hypothetical protein n=1 Tax=Listeria monocytogenes TaxID=1639 RepID=UPI001A929017